MRVRVGTPGEEHLLLTLSAFEPMSLSDYSAEAGLSKQAAFMRLQRIWDKKAIYIHHWEHASAGPLVPYFAIGSLPDAPKIAKKSKGASNREWRERTMASNPERIKESARRSTRARLERIKQDPEYAAKSRAYRAAWARKKYGHFPRALQTSLADFAMSIGSTWYFSEKGKAA